MDAELLLKVFIGSAIGVVLSPILHRVWLTLLYLFRRFKRDRLCRTWCECHITYLDEAPVIARGTWKITPGVIRKYKVINTHETGAVFRYRGSFVRERDHLVFSFEPRSHSDEVLQYRFKVPVSYEQPLVGFWLGLDVQGSVASGVGVLSQELLTDEEFHSIVGDSLFQSYELPFMKVK